MTYKRLAFLNQCAKGSKPRPSQTFEAKARHTFRLSRGRRYKFVEQVKLGVRCPNPPTDIDEPDHPTLHPFEGCKQSRLNTSRKPLVRFTIEPLFAVSTK